MNTASAEPRIEKFVFAWVVSIVSATLALLLITALFPAVGSRAPVWALPLIFVYALPFIAIFAGLPAALIFVVIAKFNLKSIGWFFIGGAVTGVLGLLPFADRLEWMIANNVQSFLAFPEAGAVGGGAAWLYLRKRSNLVS